MTSSSKKLTASDYKASEEKFFLNLLEKLGDSICLYCVTGSLARGETFPGWSDIDILLVLKSYDDGAFAKLRKALADSNQGVKIGVTFYSLNEFNHEYYKDTKTYLSIDLILKGYYKPRIMNEAIILRRIDPILRKHTDIFEFSRFLHDLKRQLLLDKSDSERTVYKLLATLIKIILRQNSITALGYKDAIENINIRFPDFNVRIPMPTEIIERPERREERYREYLKFVQWVEKTSPSLFS